MLWRLRPGGVGLGQHSYVQDTASAEASATSVGTRPAGLAKEA